MRSRLGQPSCTSSSSSAPPSLDGATSSPKYEFDGKPHGRVADRIRAIDGLRYPTNVPTSQNTRRIVPPTTPRHAASSEPPLNRSPPFSRRDASQSPVIPASPLERSEMSPTSPYLHCPIPTRVQPQLPANIERGVNLKDAFVSGTFEHSTCPRHGRELKSVKDSSVSAAGLEKGFGGAYIPTGHKVRYQVDAISPWAVAWKPLTKTEGTIVSPEICPDCLTEQDILTHELESRTGIDYAGLPLTIPTCSSTHTERGTPVLQTHPNVLVGSTHDNQTVNIPGATASGLPLDQFGYIVPADLGDMIDTIIIEHSGTLDKVVTNIRNGMTGVETTRKLSSDLAKVSEAIVSSPENDTRKPTTIPYHSGLPLKHSMVFDTSKEFLQERTKTMPELLDLIDSTAEQFGLRDTDQSYEQPRSHSERSGAHDKFPLMPGNFPFTNPSTPLVPLQPLQPTPTPQSSPVEPAGPVNPLPTSRMADPAPTKVPMPIIDLPTSEPLEATTPTTVPAPFATPLIVVETPGTDTKKDIAFSTVQTSLQILSQPEKTSPDEAPPSRQSRISKAATLSLTKHLPSEPTGTYRAGMLRPKPSDVAKQQKEQRMFQQAWLKEAASAERMNRRSRSGLKL